MRVVAGTPTQIGDGERRDGVGDHVPALEPGA